VTGLTFTHDWAKAGLMVRATLSDRSRHAMMMSTVGHGVAFKYRRRDGRASAPGGPGPAVSVPVWLRLVRSGDTLTGYYSSDGSSWTLRDRVSISLPSSVFIGLALTSHADGVIATATFDNVSVRASALPGAP
jgi:hypothetical protein